MKDTRDRILDAATRVFGRDGISGATTREIARAAGVNEVTLFRSFRNKAELLRCVVARNCQLYDDVFEGAPFATAADLRRTITAYAEAYGKALLAKEDFARTLLGELNRHPKLWQRLFVESIKPIRQKFISYLGRARKAGVIRRQVDLTTAADALTGMLLAGMIRRPVSRIDYEPELYLQTCLDLFLRGLEK